MKIRTIAFLSTFIFSSQSFAVESCGGQASPGNPLPCCSNGGNCTWWAWKKAAESGWRAIPTGMANAWDDTAAINSKLYSVSNVPTVGAIAQSDTLSSRGHVAYITAASGGNVTFTEMNCDISPAYATKTKPSSYFSKYITTIKQTGKYASASGCTVTSSKSTTNSAGDILTIYYSNNCSSNWATVKAKNVNAFVSATIALGYDNIPYPANGIGFAVSPMVQFNPSWTTSQQKSCATGKVGVVGIPTAPTTLCY